jgi:hypothetical protein
MYTTYMMQKLFVAVGILSLSFVVPHYIVFVLTLGYITIGSVSVYWVWALGILLDVLYRIDVSVLGISLPLYTSLSLVSVLLIPHLTRRLSVGI